MSELIPSIQEFLKIVPGLTIFPLSFYLAWRRLGTNVSASFAVHHERTLAKRLNTILLNNHKDKPVVIYSIQAVIQKEVTYEVQAFDPPLILKAHESLRVETEPYSQLVLSTGPYEPELNLENVELYLVLANRTYRCRKEHHPHLAPLVEFKDYARAAKSTNQFNGLVYNDNAAYAITYRMNGELRTSLIDVSGFICRGWDYRINRIAAEAMKDRASVRAYLVEAQFDKATEWFAVDHLPASRVPRPTKSIAGGVDL